MSMTRREALALSAAAAAFSLARPANSAYIDPEILDYGRSYLTCTASFNSVRFWVESRTTIIHEDKATEFFQCGSCKSENTFAEKDLFKEDNYDFLPVWGGGHWLVFRRHATASEDYRSTYTRDELWGPPEYKLKQAADARELHSFDDIREATAAGHPIVAQTIIADEASKKTAFIEYPVKTMNVSLDKKMYQVDTGPVVYPDISKQYDPAIDCFQLAFAAFNAPDFADFVIEQPTAVSESVEVLHYTKPFSMPAQNRLYAHA